MTKNLRLRHPRSLASRALRPQEDRSEEEEEYVPTAKKFRP